MKFTAKPDHCEEASPYSSMCYIPCNAPATQVVYSRKDEATYRMCMGCADHSIRNRGFKDRGPYVKDTK